MLMELIVGKWCLSIHVKSCFGWVCHVTDHFFLLTKERERHSPLCRIRMCYLCFVLFFFSFYIYHTEQHCVLVRCGQVWAYYVTVFEVKHIFENFLFLK